MKIKSDKPCETHGEVERYAANGACVPCAIERQKARYEANKEAAKEYAKEYAKTYVRPPRVYRHRPYDPEAYQRRKAAKKAQQ
jgi:hypothetical protein